MKQFKFKNILGFLGAVTAFQVGAALSVDAQVSTPAGAAAGSSLFCSHACTPGACAASRAILERCQQCPKLESMKCLLSATGQAFKDGKLEPLCSPDEKKAMKASKSKKKDAAKDDDDAKAASDDSSSDDSSEDEKKSDDDGDAAKAASDDSTSSEEEKPADDAGASSEEEKPAEDASASGDES